MNLTERIDSIFKLLSDLYIAIGTLAEAEKLDSESTELVIDSMINISSDMKDIVSVVSSIDLHLSSIYIYLRRASTALELFGVLFFCWFFFVFIRWISNVH